MICGELGATLQPFSRGRHDARSVCRVEKRQCEMLSFFAPTAMFTTLKAAQQVQFAEVGQVTSFSTLSPEPGRRDHVGKGGSDRQRAGLDCGAPGPSLGECPACRAGPPTLVRSEHPWQDNPMNQMDGPSCPPREHLVWWLASPLRAGLSHAHGPYLRRHAAADGEVQFWGNSVARHLGRARSRSFPTPRGTPEQCRTIAASLLCERKPNCPASRTS